MSGRDARRSGVLIATDLLDARPAELAVDRPVRGAVHIPASELAARAHELPPATALLRIAALDEHADEALAWCRACGRHAALAPSAVLDQAEVAVRPRLRLWRPSEWLAEVAAALEPGAALDVACGTGRDAVYLASLGWCVTGVDVLPDALDRARDLARRYLPAALAPRWMAVDLESEGAAPAATGVAALALASIDDAFHARFDLISVTRYLHRPLFPRLRRWLRPGGVLVYETFTTVHRDRHGKPARDAHVLLPGELRQLAGSLEVCEYSEDWRGSAHTARLLARRR